MHSREWLFEAERNIKVKKQLGLLSDADIDTVLGLINKVNEQDEPYDPRAKFRKKNKFVDAPPVSNTAKPNTSPVSPNVSSTKSKSNDIESIIKNLSEKDKQLLAATLQKEKEQRVQQKRKRSSAKQPVTKTSTEPKKSSGMLGKIILGLLIGIGGAAYFTDTTPQSNTTTTQAEPRQNDANKKFLRAGEMAPYKIKRFIAQSAYDEDSLKFRNWKMHAIQDPDNPNAGVYLMVSGEVNGKNRLGAYVGFKKFIIAIDPETGELESGKYYTEEDQRYFMVYELMKSMKTIDAPIPGPSD